MQIHYAQVRAPRWKADPELGRVALLHLTPGLDGVSQARPTRPNAGMLPAAPTICVGQPTSLDPKPRPGRQRHPVAATPRSAARHEGRRAADDRVPADGKWTPEVRELYADRVEAILAGHIAGFRETVIARRAYSPADLEAMNVNLVGGDPLRRACGIDQFSCGGRSRARSTTARMCRASFTSARRRIRDPGSAAAPGFWWLRNWDKIADGAPGRSRHCSVMLCSRRFAATGRSPNNGRATFRTKKTIISWYRIIFASCARRKMAR
jgi:hypothetical protein